MSTLNQIKTLKENMSKSIIGQEQLVDRLILVLLANANLLLEGLPGLAKTRAIKALAENLDCDLSRIQFTPDLLPSDITGTEIYQPESDEKFIFQKGPIFSNLILADEINRAPAKVQSALLEAMEERQVSVAGKSYQMDPLFMVIATQNPVEQEGTYPLPEAQMDRFLMHVNVDYPDPESELEVLRLNREQTKKSEQKETVKLPSSVVFEARAEIENINISENMERYIIDIVNASRHPENYGDNLKNWIEYGASPRGSIGIDKASRINAWLNDNNSVTPEDIRAVVKDCLRHRISLSYDAKADRVSADEVISEILQQVAVIA